MSRDDFGDYRQQHTFAENEYDFPQDEAPQLDVAKLEEAEHRELEIEVPERKMEIEIPERKMEIEIPKLDEVKIEI